MRRSASSFAFPMSAGVLRETLLEIADSYDFMLGAPKIKGLSGNAR